MGLRYTLIAVLLGLTACAPGAADSAATAGQESVENHRESGLRIISLTVETKTKAQSFRVELAGSRLEQAKGLMYRTSLGPDEGMLFPMDPPRKAAFWMRNTVISLDIIYIGTDRRILNIAANTIPYDETPLPSDGDASAVLELAGGRAAELGIAPGDKVDW
ncbi:MAG: DUF192 domain-containing protein [Novosphingobium sp.]|nr:DUF192 domain-containing protein [Novosphingobium sp.]